MLNKKGAIKQLIIVFAIILVVVLVTIIFININREGQKAPSPTDDGEIDLLLQENLDSCLGGLKLEREIRCLAVVKKDISICTKSEDKKSCEDDYYLVGSLLLGDQKLCDNIQNPVYISFCKNEGPSTCSNLIGDRKLNCLAIINKDLADCETAADDITKRWCKDFINFVSAIDNDDIMICENISEGERKLECQAVLTSDSSNCDKIRSTGCYDEYYYHSANLKEDQSYCEKINSQIKKEICYNEVGE